MSRHRPLFWFALFLALHGAFVRAFIPVGYMPVAVDGALRLAFCTPSGAQLSLEGHAQTPAASVAGECPYALALSAALPVALPTLGLPTGDFSRLLARSVRASTAFIAAYSARGPPHLV